MEMKTLKKTKQTKKTKIGTTTSGAMILLWAGEARSWEDRRKMRETGRGGEVSERGGASEGCRVLLLLLRLHARCVCVCLRWDHD